MGLARLGIGIAAQAFPGVGQALGVAAAIAPARMFSSGGRSGATLPGFNAGMKLHADTHFFTDSQGHEWSWNSQYGHLDPLGGNPRKPQVYQSSVLGTSAGYQAHVRLGHLAPARVVRDLESLVKTGRLPTRTPAIRPAPAARYGPAAYYKAGYFKGRSYRR